jgi:hypothetical protein
MVSDQRTVPAMGQQARNSDQDIKRSRVIYALLSIFSAILMLVASPAFADEGSIVLERSGIIYPGGFDLNTVGEIHGNVSALEVPDKGPVTFGLTSENDFYTVLASPAWYWRQTGLSLNEGSVVTVKGSKSLGKDSRLYIIAEDIRREGSDKVITLRSKNGKPVWSNASHMPGPGSRGSMMQHGSQRGGGPGGQQRRGK